MALNEASLACFPRHPTPCLHAAVHSSTHLHTTVTPAPTSHQPPLITPSQDMCISRIRTLRRTFREEQGQLPGVEEAREAREATARREAREARRTWVEPVPHYLLERVGYFDEWEMDGEIGEISEGSQGGLLGGREGSQHVLDSDGQYVAAGGPSGLYECERRPEKAARTGGSSSTSPATALDHALDHALDEDEEDEAEEEVMIDTSPPDAMEGV